MTTATAQLPFTELLPDRPGERNRAYTFEPQHGDDSRRAGVLTYASSRAFDVYAVEETPTDWFGRAFVLLKVDGTGFYNAFVSGEPHRGDLCDCRGAEAGHVCKHLQCLRDLIRNDQL